LRAPVRASLPVLVLGFGHEAEHVPSVVRFQPSAIELQAMKVRERNAGSRPPAVLTSFRLGAGLLSRHWPILPSPLTDRSHPEERTGGRGGGGREARGDWGGSKGERCRPPRPRRSRQHGNAPAPERRNRAP